LSFQLKRFPKIPVRVVKMRIHLNRLPQLCNGLIVASRRNEAGAQIRINNQRKRIELLGALKLGQAFVKISKAHQRADSIPVMGSSVIRIQRDGTFKLLGRALKIQTVKQQNLRKRSVRLCQRIVELNCLLCCCLCLRKRLR
jgi:hypothetical protein